MYAAGGGGGGGGWDTADADARAFRVCEINIDGPTDKRLELRPYFFFFFFIPLLLHCCPRREKSRQRVFGTNIAEESEESKTVSPRHCSGLSSH